MRPERRSSAHLGAAPAAHGADRPAAAATDSVRIQALLVSFPEGEASGVRAHLHGGGQGKVAGKEPARAPPTWHVVGHPQPATAGREEAAIRTPAHTDGIERMSHRGDAADRGDASPGRPVAHSSLGERSDGLLNRSGETYAARRSRSPRRVIDTRRLWTGGIMAGVVAAGVAILGLVIARGILDIPVLVQRSGQLVNANSWWYAAVAFVASLAATGLMHGLLAAAPQPYRFFAWIGGLAVAIGALMPFTTGAKLESKVAVSLLNLAIGLAIGSIVSGVGQAAARVLDEADG